MTGGPPEVRRRGIVALPPRVGPRRRSSGGS